MNELRRERLTRFIEPLREGGSLPALAEAGDGFKYVVKWRGGGHGAKALVAELIGGELARAAAMRVPELVLLDVGEEFGITEPDQEVQDLLRNSRGLNLGLHFLSGALMLDPYVNPVDADEASRIVWTDALMTNVDRTTRNTNMLVWHGSETWLIDHGAALFFHHSWNRTPSEAAIAPFPYIKDHALLRKAEKLEETDALMRQTITPEKIRQICDMVPEEWLVREDLGMSADEVRRAYRIFLTTRLEDSAKFTAEAINQRKIIMS